MSEKKKQEYDRIIKEKAKAVRARDMALLSAYDALKLPKNYNASKLKIIDGYTDGQNSVQLSYEGQVGEPVIYNG